MIKKEKNITRRPIIAQVSVFFALSIAAWSPFDVIYLAPENIIKNNAIIPEKTRAAVMTLLMIIGMHERVATSPFSRQEPQSIKCYYAPSVGSCRLNRLRPKSPSTRLSIKKARKTMISPIIAAMI